ncbi:MAG: GTP 3',8-cyclase MoaA [Candidatus Thiodiazotropha sp.]|nr:GTP 3',8-cyclase MoaA [Candidatus Thiodiazotropha taylori]MBT3064933.1 GTP 3',8-cyclase MoaA [Candidatus Thiodiazotropha sp. (ex Lucina pensylvanica)]MBV2094897.1 GTP 3',8-cyclase MoaA [Candidatus Thiodiazotropha sp. (ex Codakia orbicularis)]PUB79312.1 MAG: GTP 3',8-cyclase MoaA [gamma proteobacterium symbiont of Ctena orbiculata]
MNRESTEQQIPSSLIDRFNRRINYLRISVTDRCDLRCVYCMAEDMQFVPRSQLLTLEELFRVGKSFVDMGVRKIRITGGEPLTRRGVMQLFEALGELQGLDDLTLTTNGTLLGRYAQALKDAGVTRVNISLDSLREDRFRRITRIGDIHRTLAGIDAALKAGFKRVKLNSVIMKNRNDDEIHDLVAFAEARGMDISFIEEMPLGETGDHDRGELYYSSQQVLGDLQRRYELLPTTETTGGPARYYRIDGSDTRVGFISPHSHNFCEHCNRVRLTAEGRLLLCLGQEHSVDLRRVVRANPLDDEPLRRAIIDAMEIKPKGHEFDLTAKPVLFRHMNVTGG